MTRDPQTRDSRLSELPKLAFANHSNTLNAIYKKDAAVELPVMELFYTLQGEGFHQGKAAVFIRLAGCDVGCHWCDVKESWEVEEKQITDIADIVSAAKKFPARIAVITGGEPLMYDLKALTTALKAEGFQTHLETSGAYPRTGIWDWICFSPKKFKQPLPEIFQQANELKVIVFNKSDLEWGEQNAQNVHEQTKLYFQPEWEKSQAVLPLIIEYIKQHPKWELSLQIHKFLDLP